MFLLLFKVDHLVNSEGACAVVVVVLCPKGREVFGAELGFFVLAFCVLLSVAAGLVKAMMMLVV